jgi:hypothetical protein
MLNGDSKFLVDEFSSGLLLRCHNGSYMPDRAPASCSAATILLCRIPGQIAKVTCETTDSDTALNYRGELIGGVMATLLLHGLAKFSNNKSQHTHDIYCDNLGVISHGNNYLRSLPEHQVQQDVLILLQWNILMLPSKFRYQYVYRHVDNNAAFSDLTLPHQLNVMADSNAKQALLTDIARPTKQESFNFPMELVRIQISSKKITSSIRSEIYHFWGAKVAHNLLQWQHISNMHHFHLIAWDNVHQSWLPTLKCVEHG